MKRTYPRSVDYNATISSNQIDALTSSFCTEKLNALILILNINVFPYLIRKHRSLGVDELLNELIIC